MPYESSPSLASIAAILASSASVADAAVVSGHDSRFGGGIAVVAGVLALAAFAWGCWSVWRLRCRSRELMVANERFELVVDSAELAVWDWDLVSQEQVVNRRYAEMLGYDLEDFREGGGKLELKHIADPETWRAAHVKAEEHLAGRTPRFEATYKVKNRQGEWQWIHDVGQVVQRDAKGAALRMCGVKRDVTEAVRLRQQEQQLEREKAVMSEAMMQHQRLRSMGNLAGGIAHDFNNLLMVVRGNAEMVREIAEPGEARDMCTQIISAADAGAGLCDQMMSFVGDGAVALQVVNLNEQLMRSLEALNRAVGRQLPVLVEAPPEPMLCLGDSIRIQQVILSLLQNAYEATEDAAERRIVIRLARSVPAAAGFDALHTAVDRFTDSMTCVEVSDNGQGMDRETLASAFDPFFSTKFTGRGLGLFSALGAVKAHQGAVAVRTAPREGTTVAVWLPAAAVDAPQTAEPGGVAPLDASPERTGLTVLVVDDEPAVLSVAASLLERSGHRAVPAASGMEALAALAGGAVGIDVALVDMTMPGMSGVELLHELRARHPRVPVVLATGHRQVEMERLTEGARFDGIIHKPYDLKTILSALERACEGGSF